MVRGLLEGAWQYPFAVAVARGLGEIWFLLLALVMARHLTLEKGILIHHFRWPKERVQQVWNQFRTLLLVLIPSFFVLGMANSYQEHAFYDSLGRMAFMIGAPSEFKANSPVAGITRGAIRHLHFEKTTTINHHI